jgi:hypothetical protein
LSGSISSKLLSALFLPTLLVEECIVACHMSNGVWRVEGILFGHHNR